MAGKLSQKRSVCSERCDGFLEVQSLALLLSTAFGLARIMDTQNEIIKTGAIKEDQRKLYDFFVKHGKGEMPTREFIGRLLSQE